MEFYEVLEKRRSVRSFSPEPVPREAVRRALEAAQLSPSSMDTQPWHFFVASDEAREWVCSMIARSTRLLWDIYPEYSDDYLEKAARFFSELGGAPTVVVVTVDREPDELARKMSLLAGGGAVLAFQLALAEEGLGSVCIASATWIEEEMCRDLGLEDQEVLTVIPVGYPAEEPGERSGRMDRVVWLNGRPGASAQ